MASTVWGSVAVALLLVATAAPVMAQDDLAEATAPAVVDDVTEPIYVCVDGVCRMTDDPAPADASSTPIDTGTERVVCPEGTGACEVVDAGAALDELVADATGRLVHGAIDVDPTGEWRAVNLPTRVRCTVSGAGPSSVRLKRTRSRATIERRADGNLVAQSARAGEPPFVMVRLGPGLYGSAQPFTDGKVKGTVIAYYGMLDDDTIAGTSTMTSTLRDGGARTDCTMKRNFDMKRVPGSSPAESEVAASPDAAGEGPTEATYEG